MGCFFSEMSGNQYCPPAPQLPSTSDWPYSLGRVILRPHSTLIPRAVQWALPQRPTWMTGPFLAAFSSSALHSHSPMAFHGITSQISTCRQTLVSRPASEGAQIQIMLYITSESAHFFCEEPVSKHFQLCLYPSSPTLLPVA